MVIGGQAVLLHGNPRLTRDVDITVGVDASELPRLRKVTDELGLVSPTPDIEAFVRKTNVYPVVDAVTSVRVDLIFSFTPYETEAIRRAVGVVLEGVTVRFATVEDLIVHKLVAGRPRDIEDVHGLLLRHPVLDEAYLERWLRSFWGVVPGDLVAQLKALQRQIPRAR
jgi:predicted nucleotidyltransferase